VKADAALRAAAQLVITEQRADVPWLRRQLTVSVGAAAAMVLGLRALKIVDGDGKVLVPADKLAVAMAALLRHDDVTEALAADAQLDAQARARWLPPRHSGQHTAGPVRVVPTDEPGGA